MTAEEAPPIRPRVERLGEKVGAIVILALVVVVLYLLLTKQRPFNGHDLSAWWQALSGVALFTLFITVVAYIGGMGIGFLLGWARTSRLAVARGAATVWIESFRGTPLLVQLMLLVAIFSYYDPGNMQVQTRLLVTGILALLINTSAYQGEIFRGGLQSVAVGQHEAAKTIGLTRWGSMRYVIFPQALRLVVPPLMNEFVALLKASSLLALVGVRELTYYAKIATGSGASLLEVDTIVILLYMLMTVPLAKFVGWMERRYRIPGLGMQQESKAERKPRGARGTVVRVAGADLTRLRAWVGSRRTPEAPAGTRAEPS